LEIRGLRYFVALAEELHFARAAARVGIEQSPLSKAISEMERDLGVQLFVRKAGFEIDIGPLVRDGFTAPRGSHEQVVKVGFEVGDYGGGDRTGGDLSSQCREAALARARIRKLGHFRAEALEGELRREPAILLARGGEESLLFLHLESSVSLVAVAWALDAEER
jgi:hypothetical protein